MTSIITLIVLLFFGAAWRAKGGGMGIARLDKKVRKVIPYAFIAGALGGCGASVFGDWVMLLTAVSVLGLATGTEEYLTWGNGSDPDRVSGIEPFIDWISDKIGLIKGSIKYCWLYVAIVGVIVTAPIGGLGGLFIPAGYALGHAMPVGNKTPFAEFFAGMGCGLSALIFMELF